MDFFRIAYITIGGLLVITAICQFVFTSSPFFIRKRWRAILSESERAEYQRALSIPIAFYGILLLARSIFSIIIWLSTETVYVIGLFVVFIWTAIVNKKYLGKCFPKR